MDTKIANTKEGIDSRTRKAACESMTVVDLGKGEYKVYSGTRNAYVVNLIKETCECPDEEYNHPADGCKHRRRLEMEIGERPIPDLGGRLDVEIMVGARVDEEPVAIADGGQLLEAPATHADGCDNPEYEGLDAGRRPLLSFECWDEWAAYSEEQRIEETADQDQESEDDQDRPRRSEPADFGGGESTGVIDL